MAVGIVGGTTTVVVGAPRGGSSGYGAAYVFTASGGGGFTQQAELEGVNPGTESVGIGQSVALTVDGAVATIAVGAPVTNGNTLTAGGAVFLYTGSGSAYALQTTLQNPRATSSGQFGQSVAIATSGGTHTVIVGAPNDVLSGTSSGSATVFTGNGASYTSVTLTEPGASNGDQFGSSVAVAVSGGRVALAVGAPNKTAGVGYPNGAAYVFTGTLASGFTPATLSPDIPTDCNTFGSGVAVGFSYSVVEVAVGGAVCQHNGGPVFTAAYVFTENGSPTTFTRSLLPEASASVNNDGYGMSMAYILGQHNAPIVVAGAPFGPNGTGAGTVTVSQWDAAASVRAVIGDRSQVIASAAGTHSGTPFRLVAGLVDGNGVPLTGRDLTFTVTPVSGAGGLFSTSDPNSTTLHVTTNSSDNATTGTKAGQTDILPLYPSDTAGTFTVSATADGTSLSATFTLTILPTVPSPTINAVIPPRVVSAAAPAGVPRAATPTPPPGLVPALILIDPNNTYEIAVNGSGFVSQANGTTAFFQHGSDPPIQIDCVYHTATQLFVYVTGYNMLNTFTADTTATITVYNPPGSGAGGAGGGYSNPATLHLAMPRSASSGSTLNAVGALNLLVPPDASVVAPPVQVSASGMPPMTPVTGSAHGFVGANGLITNDGGSIIGNDGASLITNDGGSIIGNDGASLITNDGGSIVNNNGAGFASYAIAAQPAVAATAPSPRGAAPRAAAPRVTPTSATGNYLASTDRYGVIMAPPVMSNGVPGTFTRTLSVDGIANPVTYTLTNLNPHDGHPAAISALSRTSAVTGGSTFSLTATGTGFVSGSVLSFGGVQLSTAVDSATQLHATVPTSLLNYPGTLSVRVINPDTPGMADGGASLPATFIVIAPPTLTAIGPASGGIAGGATVTFTGTNFVVGGSTSVTFDGLAATNVTVVNGTTLTAVTPAHAAGVVNVVVTVNGVPLTLMQAYTYGVISPRPTAEPSAAGKPGVIGAKPVQAATGVAVGAGTPTPNAQPMRR